MPNTSIPAAGEAMPSLSRRKALGLTAAATVPPVLAVASVPVAAAVSPETLDERIHRLETELLLAMGEKWPNGAEIVRAPYGNHMFFFMEKDTSAEEAI